MGGVFKFSHVRSGASGDITDPPTHKVRRSGDRPGLKTTDPGVINTKEVER